MSSYIFVDFCYKEKTIKSLIDFCTSASRELDLPGTGTSRINYFLEHDHKFKDEVFKSMIDDGLDPLKDNIIYYIWSHSNFNLVERFGEKAHWAPFTKDLLDYAINHYKENVNEAKKAIKDNLAINKYLSKIQASTKEAVIEIVEQIQSNESSNDYWKDELKIAKYNLKRFKRIKFWYYLTKFIPKCQLLYYRD